MSRCYKYKAGEIYIKRRHCNKIFLVISKLIPDFDENNFAVMWNAARNINSPRNACNKNIVSDTGCN